MPERNISTPILFIISVALVFGFAYLYQQNATLETRIGNIELSAKPISPQQESGTSTQQKPEQETTPITSESMPTAIIFEAQSSPILSPQSPIIITIESIAKNNDSLNVNIKTFTSNASSYTALEMQKIISLVYKDGTIVRAANSPTTWKSMPPKSFVTGTLTIPLEKNAQTALLRVDTGKETKIYSFDLNKKTYKEISE